MDYEEKYASLQDEAAAKTRKLKEGWKQLQAVNNEVCRGGSDRAAPSLLPPLFFLFLAPSTSLLSLLHSFLLSSSSPCSFLFSSLLPLPHFSLFSSPSPSAPFCSLLTLPCSFLLVSPTLTPSSSLLPHPRSFLLSSPSTPSSSPLPSLPR